MGNNKSPGNFLVKEGNLFELKEKPRKVGVPIYPTIINHFQVTITDVVEQLHDILSHIFNNFLKL